MAGVERRLEAVALGKQLLEKKLEMGGRIFRELLFY